MSGKGPGAYVGKGGPAIQLGLLRVFPTSSARVRLMNARENLVSLKDLKTCKGRDGRISAEFRESAYDVSSNDVFGGFDRKSGFR
jgi:hypothetical protein